MTKLSDIAWRKTEEVVRAIQEHAFNTELANGTLAVDKFAYYIEQDTLYLRDFARSLAAIAARAPLAFVRDFLALADGVLIAEQEVVHSFFRRIFNFQETGKLTPATLAYNSYHLQMSYMAPIEIAIASILPCFWVYREVGLSIAKDTKADNPYAKWIETYSGEAFGQSVAKAITIFDALASKASEDTKNEMLDAFYKSTVFEWHFWNDSYNKTAFDGFVLKDESLIGCC